MAADLCRGCQPWRHRARAGLGYRVKILTGTPCVLCESVGGLPVFRNEDLRIIQAIEPGFPALYRVIWNRHVAEFSDLTAAERNTCMAAVVQVERALRAQLQPDKINLAALGNLVPHLHWHVVARFDWDSHFPGSIWSIAQRPDNAGKLAVIAARCVDVNRLIAHEMAQFQHQQA